VRLLLDEQRQVLAALEHELDAVPGDTDSAWIRWLTRYR
jgi:hypothetical protein